MLQQEVGSQDQFLQLHTALNENQGVDAPHNDVVEFMWDDKSRFSGWRRTSPRKNQEVVKITPKVLPSKKIIKPAVFPSLT